MSMQIIHGYKHVYLSKIIMRSTFIEKNKKMYLINKNSRKEFC
jgi:hypothetical protein